MNLADLRSNGILLVGIERFLCNRSFENWTTILQEPAISGVECAEVFFLGKCSLQTVMQLIYHQTPS